MAESTNVRRKKLQKALRERGKQIPQEEARLGDALWNDTDSALSHEACLAALPTFVRAEAQGEPVAALFAAVKHHLDRCDGCATKYIDLLEVALADERDQLPQPARTPVPDLSFLPRLRDSESSAGQRVRELLMTIKSQLRGVALSPNVALGGAYAQTAKPKIEDGQTQDGTLRWRVVEDDERNLIIRFGSHVLDLEGVRLRLKAGRWEHEIILTRVAPDQVGAEIILPHGERPDSPKEGEITLLLESAEAP